MKNQILFSLISILTIGTSHAATIPWWEQPTVCRLDPTDCYRGMGAGFDTEIWDTTSKCWGKKLICPNALAQQSNEPVALEKIEIQNGKKVLSDFDTDLLSADGDCFGRRKTRDNGTSASVNGTYVNVYCPGILDNPDEELENGEIVYKNQPTCSTLARDGYAAVNNGRCIGKYYNSSEYFIDCGTGIKPTRLIVLNGADYTATSTNAPKTKNDVDKLFDTMYSTSQSQKEKYFK